MLAHSMSSFKTILVVNADSNSGEQARRRAVDLALGVESRVAYGSPRRKILEACDACGCDLLVIPEPGRQGILDRLIAPSILRVARVSRVPVLVVGPSGPDQPSVSAFPAGRVRTFAEPRGAVT
jgi:Universal stress protein family